MTSVYGFQPSSVFFSMQNSDFVNRHTSLYGSQISSVVLSTHNRVLSTRIKRLYGFQPSPVVLCMQNSNFSTWITSLYGSQPSSEVFAFKPAAFGLKLHVSIGPRTHPWFSACKTACLASELLVSMDTSPHLWFLHAKQRLLEQNYKYLCVPALICGFCIHNSAFWTRISSLNGSQTSSVVLSTHNCVINIDYMCSSPRLWFCACKTATLALELLVSMGPSLHLCFLLAKQRLLDPNNKSLLVPDNTCPFVHAIQRD